MLALKAQTIHLRGRLGLVVSVTEWENGGAIEISCAGVTDRLIFNGSGALLHIHQRVDARDGDADSATPLTDDTPPVMELGSDDAHA